MPFSQDLQPLKKAHFGKRLAMRIVSSGLQIIYIFASRANDLDK